MIGMAFSMNFGKKESGVHQMKSAEYHKQVPCRIISDSKSEVKENFFALLKLYTEISLEIHYRSGSNFFLYYSM